MDRRVSPAVRAWFRRLERVGAWRSGSVARWSGVAAVTLACSAESSGPTPPPPAAGSMRWQFATPDGMPLAAERDTRGMPYLYVALKEGGVLVLRLAGASPPTEVARIPKTSLGTLDATTLVQRGSQLFVGLGDFFSAQGSRTGLAVVSLQEPERPVVTAMWASTTVLSGTTALLLDGNHAFLGAKRHGVMVFDVSQADTVRRIAEVLPDPGFPKANPSAAEHPNARGLAIAGNLLYVANDAGGLRVIDISDRTAPREIARYINAGVVNKPQAYNSVMVANNVAYVGIDYCGLEMIDVSNPRDARRLGWWNPWACETAANTWFNSPGHANQLVLDAARRLVYLSAGASELVAIDVSDPARPILAGQFKAPGTDQGAWGIAAAAEETYVTYITALLPFRGTWSGIRGVTPLR